MGFCDWVTLPKKEEFNQAWFRNIVLESISEPMKSKIWTTISNKTCVYPFLTKNIYNMKYFWRIETYWSHLSSDNCGTCRSAWVEKVDVLTSKNIKQLVNTSSRNLLWVFDVILYSWPTFSFNLIFVTKPKTHEESNYTRGGLPYISYFGMCRPIG